MLKERHPETYALNAMRQRAKQRGMPFTITLSEWREFCRKTGYLENKGKEPDSYTVDRIDDSKGYHIWNIRILSHAENSRDQYRNFEPGEEREFADEEDFSQDAPAYQPEPGEPF